MESNVLKLHAYFTSPHFDDSHAPTHFAFEQDFATVEAATAFVAQFPKSVKMFTCTVSTSEGGKYYLVNTRANLTSNGINGGINETGLRRYQAVVKAAAKLGVEIVCTPNASNAYETQEAFEQAIGAR
jgi:hypothetical protein